MAEESSIPEAAPADTTNGQVNVSVVDGTAAKSKADALPADSPAPWTLKCEAYGIPFRLKPGKLPPGLYHPLDTPPEGPGNDDFQGVCRSPLLL